MGKIIVTAGNTVIGVAGKHQQLANTVNGALPATTPVTATVTKVLTKTGQTLVDLGNGNSLILGKAGGKIGDLVKIDLGSQTVIGAPNGSPLLGVSVLSPGSGNIATISSGALPAGGALPSVIDTAVNAVSGATAPILTDPVGALSNPGSTVSNVVGAVTAPVSTITNTIGTVVTPVAAVTSTVESLTSPITAIAGGLTGGATAGGNIITPVTTVTNTVDALTAPIAAVTGGLTGITGGLTGGAAAGGSVTTPVTAVTGGAGAGGVVTTVTNTVGGLVGGLTGGLKKKH